MDDHKLPSSLVPENDHFNAAWCLDHLRRLPDEFEKRSFEQIQEWNFYEKLFLALASREAAYKEKLKGDDLPAGRDEAKTAPEPQHQPQPQPKPKASMPRTSTNPADTANPLALDKHKAQGLNRHAFDTSVTWPEQRRSDEKAKAPQFEEQELAPHLDLDKNSLSISHAISTYSSRLAKDTKRLKQFMEDHGMYHVCEPCKKDSKLKATCDHGWPCSGCQDAETPCEYTWAAEVEDPNVDCSVYGKKCVNVHARTVMFFESALDIDATEAQDKRPSKSFDKSRSAKQANCNARQQSRVNTTRPGQASSEPSQSAPSASRMLKPTAPLTKRPPRPADVDDYM